jgi:hypothetical protein
MATKASDRIRAVNRDIGTSRPTFPVVRHWAEDPVEECPVADRR